MNDKPHDILLVDDSPESVSGLLRRSRAAGSVYLEGTPPRFTEVDRVCRKIDAANIWQLRKWTRRLLESSKLLAYQFNRWCSKGHLPGHFPGLKSLDAATKALDHARKVANARTYRRNPVGTGGIPRRLVGVSG